MINYLSFNNFLRFSLYTLAFLPAFIFRDFTLDNELRYLSIADEAIRNGSLFTFSNHGVPYADKPPLFLWIVMLGKIIFGTHNMLFLGIFSFVPAMIILYIMDKWIEEEASGKERIIAQLMLLTSIYFIGPALVIRMDMLMSMFIVLSLYSFYRFYKGENIRMNRILFPLFIFLAIFSKGPIGAVIPLVSTLAFLSFKGKILDAGRYWGWRTISILILLSGSWFAGVYFEDGSSYLQNLVFNQTVNRAVNSFHHKEPFYYYFISIWYLLAPWSLLSIGILVMGLRAKFKYTDLELFFLVVTLSTFVVLSLISAKLQVYLLPSLPFFIYISVLWISRFEKAKITLFLMGIPSFFFLIALPATVTILVLNGILEPFAVMILIVSSFIISLSGGMSIKELLQKRLKRAIVIISTGLLAAMFILSFLIPSKNSTIGMGEICDQAREKGIDKGIKNYYCYNISRYENLDVYLGTKPRKLLEYDLRIMNIEKPAIVFIPKEDIQADHIKKILKGKKITEVGNFSYIVMEN